MIFILLLVKRSTEYIEEDVRFLRADVDVSFSYLDTEARVIHAVQLNIGARRQNGDCAEKHGYWHWRCMGGWTRVNVCVTASASPMPQGRKILNSRGAQTVRMSGGVRS
jgi:hypothetical protein